VAVAMSEQVVHEHRSIAHVDPTFIKKL